MCWRIQLTIATITVTLVMDLGSQDGKIDNLDGGAVAGTF